MKGSSHLMLGLAVPVAASVLLDVTPMPPDAAAWAGLVVGSLLPDVDGDGEIVRFGNWLPRVTPDWIEKTLNRIGLTISKIIKSVLGHRGPCHWPIWGLAMTGAGWYYGITWLVWLGVGFGLHLLGDIITVQGIPAFGPLSSKKVSLFPMRVGGLIESGLGLALCGVVMWCGFVLMGVL